MVMFRIALFRTALLRKRYILGIERVSCDVRFPVKSSPAPWPEISRSDFTE